MRITDTRGKIAPLPSYKIDRQRLPPTVPANLNGDKMIHSHGSSRFSTNLLDSRLKLCCETSLSIAPRGTKLRFETEHTKASWLVC